MQILLANPRGFCAGVDRAIDIVERAIELFGAPIYVRHEVVHNRYVVERLRSLGAVFVEELDEVPDDAQGAYDFGLGAGFYVDATQAPFNKHYRMWTYVTKELPALVAENFPTDMSRQSIMGHSMGGHGALTIGLTFPERFRAVSAFSPIVAPSRVPWGQKALRGYLGNNEEEWRKHDAVALIEDGARIEALLVDQGDADQFLVEQLRPQLLQDACRSAGIDLSLHIRAGYDTAIISSPPLWPIICAGTQTGSAKE